MHPGKASNSNYWFTSLVELMQAYLTKVHVMYNNLNIQQCGSNYVSIHICPKHSLKAQYKPIITTYNHQLLNLGRSIYTKQK
jgi:hypothetical protein